MLLKGRNESSGSEASDQFLPLLKHFPRVEGFYNLQAINLAETEWNVIPYGPPHPTRTDTFAFTDHQ